MVHVRARPAISRGGCPGQMRDFSHGKILPQHNAFQRMTPNKGCRHSLGSKKVVVLAAGLLEAVLAEAGN
jgi:hypothetical protein